MVRISVIGVGGWGKNHARALSELNALSGICDIDQVRAENFAGKYGVKWYTSVEDLLAKEKPDGAIVSTPTLTHLGIAKQLMEKKVNVLVEKPITPSSLECEELVSLARRNNVVLTTGLIERFNPVVNEVRGIIASKQYGDPLMLEFHRENRRPTHISDVGIIYDTAVHDIDTALYLFDDRPNVVFARAGSKGGVHEDFAAIILGFKNQRIAFIASNWITPKKVRCFTTVCTEAIITGDFITQEIKVATGDSTIIPRLDYKEPLMLELKNFIDAIEGRAEPLVGPDDALRTTRVAESALLSSRSGSQIYLDPS
ncbi:MAG: Gfo/Idh/MocA family protein [Nitrososphaerales archaeon]